MTSLPTNPANADASREQADRQLDSLLDAWMTPPEGLSQRICSRCRDYAGEEKFLRPALSPRRGLWGQSILAMAACLCLLVSLAVLLWDRSQDVSSPEGVQVMALAPVMPLAPKMAAVAAPAPALLSREKTDLASLPLRERGFSFQDDLSLRRRTRALPSQNVTAASAAQGGFSEAHSNVSPLPAAEREVTHVWLAPRKLSEEKLEDFLKRNPVLAQGSAVPDEKGIYTVSLLAMDTEIQHTVDVLFRDLHWKLLSPDSPQPGQGGNTPITGKPVRYTLKIIPQN
ncbi:MAG: hypothetical protein ACI4SG_05750 [Oligosphaeraceae bacterium]